MLIKDPFGNQVLIEQSILDWSTGLQSLEEVYDSVGSVIEKPTMIFGGGDNPSEYFYLRAIGWNFVLLIRTKRENDHFEIKSYELNPSSFTIGSILKQYGRLQ